MEKRVEAPCSVCGIREFAIDRLGFKFCKFGHQVEGFQEETLEFDEQVKMRKMHTGRGHKKEKSNEIYYGENYQFLHLQLFQYILHLQCQYLIEHHDFPEEFEEAVKEIWLLYINFNDRMLIDLDKLGHPVPRKLLNLPNIEEDDELDNLDLSSNESNSSEDENDIDANNDNDDNNLEKKHPKQMITLFNSHGEPNKVTILTLPWTIPFLYLGALSLQIHIMLLDLQLLVLNNQLPYRNITSLIPQSYSMHYNSAVLLSGKVPNMVKLERITNYLGCILYKNYQVKFTPFNVPLVIYRIVTHFELPPAFFHAIYYVFNKMELYIGYDQCHFNSLPFSKVIGTFIIVMKLVFGFDGELRSPDPVFKLFSNDCDQILNRFEKLTNNFYYKLKPNSLGEYIERFQNDKELALSQLKAIFPEKSYQSEPQNPQGKSVLDGTINNILMSVLDSTKENSNSLPNTTSQSNLPISFDISYPSDETPIKPGSRYINYFYVGQRNLMDLPPFYHRLLICAAKFAQIEPEDLHFVVKDLERQFFVAEN